MNKHKNFFIALEGIDGSGKSTQLKLLSEALQEKGHKIYSTCEPTKSRIGQIIRDAFTHKIELDHKVIAGLFVADRLNHLLDKNEGIITKLTEGYTVITDRYYFSSYAYQGVHVPLDWVIQANAMSAELKRPDLNIYVDIDPATSMNRLQKTRESIELYETFENLQNVRDKYLEAINKLKNQEEIFIVDGTNPPKSITNAIMEKINSLTV
ncbi:dTMP kinase [Membranihabitans maritimus]|uniref:dTMP kinase n=1 Tax=Membranihabitans maritimus TaxID=2904244 RepID=UPI001EFFB02E|nr:dTMP kinase [Membranihabitans maritimus]